MKKGFHKTKDGRTVKKGLYYNINQKDQLKLQKNFNEKRTQK